MICAPETTRTARIASCTQCGSLTFTPVSKAMKCGECGCFIRMKVLLAGATCPLGKWAV